MADIIVLTILGLAVFFVLRYRIRGSKQAGGSCGCSGDRISCRFCKKTESRKNRQSKRKNVNL